MCKKLAIRRDSYWGGTARESKAGGRWKNRDGRSRWHVGRRRGNVRDRRGNTGFWAGRRDIKDGMENISFWTGRRRDIRSLEVACWEEEGELRLLGWEEVGHQG